MHIRTKCSAIAILPSIPKISDQSSFSGITAFYMFLCSMIRSTSDILLQLLQRFFTKLLHHYRAHCFLAIHNSLATCTAYIVVRTFIYMTTSRCFASLHVLTKADRRRFIVPAPFHFALLCTHLSFRTTKKQLQLIDMFLLQKLPHLMKWCQHCRHWTSLQYILLYNHRYLIVILDKKYYKRSDYLTSNLTCAYLSYFYRFNYCIIFQVTCTERATSA